MRIELADGALLRGDCLLRAIQRFDLTPIPSTLELAVRSDDKVLPQLVVGKIVKAGASEDAYRIVKAVSSSAQWPQGAASSKAVELTCILDGLYAMSQRLPRAVIAEGRSLGAIYRACGAQVRVTDDIPVPRFACLAGQFPSEAVAQVMQEEAAVPVWTKARALRFVRYADLFLATPVDSLDHDAGKAVESPYLEQHEVPWAYSTDASGQIVMGNRTAARGAVFLPRTNARVLANMSVYLAVRRVLQSGFAGHIRAGDAVDIAGVRHVVATVAHQWSGGSDGSTDARVTRVWLARLQR